MNLIVLLSLPTKAFTLVCRPIHKHFRGDDITERQEHLHQLSIPKLLGQMVDKQVTALWSYQEKKKTHEWREIGNEKAQGGGLLWLSLSVTGEGSPLESSL